MIFDSRAFRNTLGRFVTGVTVVTTRHVRGDRVGVTANSFNSVSLDPPLILWSLNRDSSTLASFEGAGYFAVHILGQDQIDLSQRFATPSADKFAGLKTTEGNGGVPLLEGCAARLECRTYNRHPAGDHTIFIGEVIVFEASEEVDPLLFHGGRYTRLQNLPTSR